MSDPRAYEIAQAGTWTGAAARIALTYDQRLLRRKKLVAQGVAFFVDLPHTVSVHPGDAFVLDDGRMIEVAASDEDLFDVHGPEIVRYAWHIGNRHTPCQILPDRLLIQRDPVLRRMIEGLGGHVHEITAPFTPEGGAYGHGRTMGHEHGGHEHGGHDHDHGAHDHDHAHD